MNSLLAIATTLHYIYVLVALQSLVVANRVPGLEHLYSSQAYKQSVAFDAPVIEPEKTLQQLRELREMIPENRNVFADYDNQPSELDSDGVEANDKWIANEHYGIMLADLESLLELSKYQDAERCSYDEFKFLNINRRGASLSSPQQDRGWGPNILAFIKHYKLKTIDYCRNKLVRIIAANDGPLMNFDLIKGVVEAMIPKGISSFEQYQNLFNFKIVADGVNRYLRSSIANFDEKLRKSQTRKEIHNKFELIKKTCDAVESNLGDRGFVATVMEDEQVAADVFKNRDLIELAVGIEVCLRVIKSERFDEAIVKINYGYIEKIKDLLNYMIVVLSQSALFIQFHYTDSTIDSQPRVSRELEKYHVDSSRD